MLTQSMMRSSTAGTCGNLWTFLPVMRDGRQLTYMTVEITGPLQLSCGDREARTWQALNGMAQEAGFDTSHGGWQQPG